MTNDRPQPQDLPGDISVDYGDDDQQLCIMQGVDELSLDSVDAALELTKVINKWAAWRKVNEAL